MKKRVVSFLLALLMVASVPAETAFAMPVAQDVAAEATKVEETEETEEDSEETEPTENPEETEEEQETDSEKETEEPTENPEETTAPEEGKEEETEEAEPTETPADAEESASPSATPEAEEDVMPTETPTAAVSPSATPVATASIAPTAKATASPTASPTVSPSATPSVAPTAEVAAPTPALPVEQAAEGALTEAELSAKVVGSNGVQYEDVAYLSARTVNALPDDTVDAYLEMCDEIAKWDEAGMDYKDVVISVNSKGELQLNASIPISSLYTEEMQQQFLPDGEISELTEESETEESAESVEETEAPEEETEETDASEEETEETEAPEEETEETESSEEEKTEETDASVEEEATEETPETEEVVEGEEALTGEELPVAEGAVTGELVTSVAATEENVIIVENELQASAYSVEEEIIDSMYPSDFDTIMQNENYFRNQLSSGLEISIYDAAKKKMVKSSKNSFTYHTTYLIGIETFANSASALISTYPNSFNWMNVGTGSIRYSCRYRYRDYNYTVSIDKSKHYKSSLETNAKKKVNQLVAEAKDFAAVNYPSNPTYGMIYYFDKWICENNYYNYTGTSEYYSDLISSTYYYCHSAYGILLQGYGVCQSYALAMSRLLDAAGIRNMYVLGSSNGEGHAWNIVQMPNGAWYMLDSTWNDKGSSSNRTYLLSAKDSSHVADGATYPTGKTFTFPTLNGSKYTVTQETLNLNVSSVILRTGTKYQLSLATPSTVPSGYYDKYAKTWASSNTRVAKVDKNGKVTAGSTPGSATITMTMAGKQITSVVYVYQFTNLTFNNTNKKTSYKETYANADTLFNTNDVRTYTLNVNQKGTKTKTAQQIASSANLVPTVTTNKASVATATVSLSGDTLTLKVQPHAIGTAKITVKFAGKSATYNITVKQQLQSAWFNALPEPYNNPVAYTGKAYKPKITKSTLAPAKVKYSIKYSNNTNAGTEKAPKAMVVITGSGSYCGTVTREFTISPLNITSAEFKACTASVKYSGKAQAPKTTVKFNKKTLKAGKDYVICYNNSTNTTAPTNKGTYTIYIKGQGNYTGVVATPKSFEITANTLDKVSMTCTAKMKLKYDENKNPIPLTPKVTVKIGKNVLPESDYTVTYYKVETVNKKKVETKVASMTAIGTYKVVVTPKGNNVTVSKKRTSLSKTFKIVK